ncbi:MAG: chromate reductase [Paracoccaceae bacterium]|jgi:chromate reductase
MPSRSKILVFAATNSSQSINKRLAGHAAKVLQDELAALAEIEIIDLNDYEMPIYSPEREKAGIPQLAQDFCDKIAASDGLIISFAEYNGTYTAAFKNIFDWASRISMKVFQGKPTLLLATSMGGRGGQGVMAAAQGGLPHFGANITSSFNFGPFSQHFDADKNRLKTPELALELREALVAFQAALPVS